MTSLPHPALQSNGTAFAVRNPRFGIKKGTAFAVPFFAIQYEIAAKSFFI